MSQPAMERWATVKRIHQLALDKDPSERAAFVDQSCGGDDTLRREVESLLTYATDAEAFLERPAIDIASKPPAASWTTLVGRTVSHYQVLSLLGAGGMGEVYLARDPRLDRTVALKILPGELAADPDRMQRFAREARAASALNHPNVATIYDVGESDGLRFIVMEHVEGETIAARIGRPLPAPEVVDIVVQAADALDVAHAKGITHRDIKPANLMVTARQQVKVLDFGIAKMRDADGEARHGGWSSNPETAAGSVIGSGPYMSPEQIRSGEVDPRSDVFSLGVVLSQMTTGELPFSGGTPAEAMDRILNAAPEPMTRFTPNIQPELERITLKCLEKAVEHRYQSARELLTDLWRLKRQQDADVRGGRAAGAHVAAAPVGDSARPIEVADLLRQGWGHLRSGSFFELPNALSAFQAAADLDPMCAAAHAGVALAKIGQGVVRASPYAEAFSEAKGATLRALAMDDRSADAQVALGQVLFLSEWKWAAAERSFQRALALNPNHAEAYLHYGGLVEALGDLDRGFHLKLQGLECNSTSALAHVLVAVSFWNQRRYEDVIVWVNKALDRDPRHLFARELLTGAYWMMGDFERALAEDLKRAELRSPDEHTLAALKRMIAEAIHGYRRGGFAEASRLVVEYRQRSAELLSDGTARAERGNAGLGLVVHYALAGNLDAAFEHLHRAIDARDPGLVHLAVAPSWDSLRADPRFNECLARMQLR